MLKVIVLSALLKARFDIASWLGNGHTVETDPSQRGWQMRELPVGDSTRYQSVLCGRKGDVEGCFLAVDYHGQLEVYLFLDHKPSQVSECVLNDSIIGENEYGIEYPSRNITDTTSGWGLQYINLIERIQKEIRSR
jgi:hypothetical protein